MNNDPKEGWKGGTFKIKSGLPEGKHDEANVQEITPRYNQGIIFNNNLNSHGVTEVMNASKQSKRDIIVIPINLTKLPQLKLDKLAQLKNPTCAAPSNTSNLGPIMLFLATILLCFCGCHS